MRQKKVLFIANISKHILRFHLPYLRWFKQNGFETHVASNGSEEIPFCDVKHLIPIQRSPFSLLNIRAHRLLKQIIDANDFSIIHGHTPMGGVLSRTASRNARKNGSKVLYTAHGFHFFKGAPLINWIIFYPVEKILSKYTDAIITINQEDFQLLFDKNFKCPGKYLINGIGVNGEKFIPVTPSEKSDLRKEYGYNDASFILIYVAEFIRRKNHKFIIDSAQALLKRIPGLKILFAGRGELFEEMKEYYKNLDLFDTIEFLGYRTDVEKLMAISDVGISSSRQEGLGLNLAEEMLVGLPVVATQDRGHRELVKPGINGFLFEQNNMDQFVDYICSLAENKTLRETFGSNARTSAQKYSLSNAIDAMAEIYKKYII
ncbi:MAG: glycosyltransferase family 4 protein [Bacteroidales bacterium]|jgi:glycosyltransferase EpsD